MTDRLNGFWVSLEQDLREDDAAPILAAVLQIRGVAAVEPNVRNSTDWFAESRVRMEFRQKLFDALK